jgi:hypothetical protein
MAFKPSDVLKPTIAQNRKSVGLKELLKKKQKLQPRLADTGERERDSDSE